MKNVTATFCALTVEYTLDIFWKKQKLTTTPNYSSYIHAVSFISFKSCLKFCIIAFTTTLFAVSAKSSSLAFATVAHLSKAVFSKYDFELASRKQNK